MGEKKIQRHEIDQWRRATLGKQWEMRTMWEIPGRTPSFEISDPKKTCICVHKSLSVHANELKKKTEIELLCVHVDQVLLDQYTLYIYINIYIV